jgi:large conductance mechanosensitive channel
MLKEFRTFIENGNVMDLAVGVIIGGAFGKITASLVYDILMPFIGLILPGGVKGAIVLKAAQLDAAGAIIEEAVVMNYGNFLNSVINFLLVAWIIFLIVRAVNRMREKND